MSYQIYEKDDLFEMIRNFLKEYSVSELLEIVADAIEERSSDVHIDKRNGYINIL